MFVIREKFLLGQLAYGLSKVRVKLQKLTSFTCPCRPKIFEKSQVFYNKNLDVCI